MARLAERLAGQDRSVWLLAVLMLLALVMGGGGSPAALAEMGLQIVLAAGLAAWFWVVSRASLAGVPSLAWAVAALVLVVPAVQLIPVPPGVWHGLAGRGDEVAALDLVGQGGTWRPLSIAPYRTLASLLAMVGPALLVPVGASLSVQGRMVLLLTLVLGGLLSILLGAAQLAQGLWSPLRLYTPDSPSLDGFFANRNAQADLVLVALVALAAVGADLARRGVLRRRAHVAALALAGTLVLGCAVVMTGSRMGMALLVLALGAEAVILRPVLGLSRRAMALGGAALLVLAAGGVMAARGHTALSGPLARFGQADAYRPEIWQNTLYAARLHAPWGAGMGTFMPVYAAVEKLEGVDVPVINRAHDEYIELALESGWLGLLISIAVVCILVFQMLATFRNSHGITRAQGMCSVASLAIIMLHSLVDYPFRTMSLACVAGLLAGFLFPVRANLVPARREPFGEVKEPL